VDVVTIVQIAMCVGIVQRLIVQIVTLDHGYKQEIATNNLHPHTIVQAPNVMHKLVIAQKLFVPNYIHLV
jgi:hypothetical protein